MTIQLSARHSARDGQHLTAVKGLPAADQFMTYDDIYALARQLREIAIDAQRQATEQFEGIDSEGGSCD